MWGQVEQLPVPLRQTNVECGRGTGISISGEDIPQQEMSSHSHTQNMFQAENSGKKTAAMTRQDDKGVSSDPAHLSKPVECGEGGARGEDRPPFRVGVRLLCCTLSLTHKTGVHLHLHAEHIGSTNSHYVLFMCSSIYVVQLFPATTPPPKKKKKSILCIIEDLVKTPANRNSPYSYT